VRSRWATLTGGHGRSEQGGQQRVNAADPGVTEPRTLLGVAVYLGQRVVQIEQRVTLSAELAGLAALGEQVCQPRHRQQEPRRHRVELPRMTEG
jgi:hypothetical protein